MSEQELPRNWRAARPAMAGVHLDSAACARQSHAAIEAAAQHARHEAEVGGYVAAQAAAPALDAGRAAIGALTGMSTTDVVFTTGSCHALDLLLGAWPGQRTLACLPGEFGPNLALMAAHGFTIRALPVEPDGRLRVTELAGELRRDPPALVHLDGVASHRGIAQPIAEAAQVCAAHGVPLVIDAAQALIQLDCAVGAAAVYSSSRKWSAGPRGVGFLAVTPELAQALVRRVPPADWDIPGGAWESFEHVEANLAARLGFSVAIGEIMAAGPAAVRRRLAAVGAATRSALDGVAGWRVVERADEPTAITTLLPPEGLDPAAIRAALIAEHGIVTTAAEAARAPFELTGPVLRLSPHVDATVEDLEQVVAALTALTPGSSGNTPTPRS